MGGGLMAVTMEWRGLTQVVGGLRAAEKAAPQELAGAMQKSLSLVQGEATRALGGHGLRRMAGALSSDVRVGGTSIQGTLTVAHPGFWVERGRRPGKQPPIAAIRGWALERGLTPFLVARAIGRRGIRARPFLRPAFERNKRGIEALFARAGGAILARIKGA
jgi:hypothetical protein